MEIKILQFIEGAKQARGLTVIIDVFRAFSLECYMFNQGVLRIFPVGDLKEAYELKRREPSRILVGERHGKICEGFEYGNSPSQIKEKDLTGKTMIHTTSAGTQGIANAKLADEIITGSLVNAKAVAQYIKQRAPKIVSLVCMGNAGVTMAREDIICAEYIRSLLLGEPIDIKAKVLSLRENGGEHFFDPNQQGVYPEEDFWMCIQYDIFPYVLEVRVDDAEEKFIKRVDVSCKGLD